MANSDIACRCPIADLSVMPTARRAQNSDLRLQVAAAATTRMDELLQSIKALIEQFNAEVEATARRMNEPSEDDKDN